jgi:hypothetical protein
VSDQSQYERHEKDTVFSQTNGSSDFLEWSSSPARHLEIMFMATMVLPSGCLLREATNINRDVKYLTYIWHDEHNGAVRRV